MLNWVEMGISGKDRHKRLGELARFVMGAAGVKGYRMVTAFSDVYGDTLDVKAGSENIEVASGAMGPHPLDKAWGVTEAWVGLGFGVERLLMVLKNTDSLAKVGRSLSYLDGNRLNI